MVQPAGPPASRRTSRRRGVLVVVSALAVACIAVALILFQPWKLWVDDTVDQAVPAGAVPITVPAPTAVSAPTPTATPATTVPANTDLEVAAAATTAPTVPPPTTPPPPGPAPSGTPFAGIDHDTTGNAVLVEDAAGTRYVRLEGLDTSNGPDLFVYLSTNPPDGEEGRFDDDVVDLGRLQGNVGSSNYVIPPGTDLARYASVVIWCDRFDSAFGAAARP